MSNEGENNQPRIGIGVLIQNEEGKILLGLRKGSHGSGQWCFPGGHLDFGETIFNCAKRETKEETGLEVKAIKIFSIADEMAHIKTDNKHYVNIGVLAENLGGEPQIMEPDKCLEWKWFSLDSLPDNLFEGTKLCLNSFKAGKFDYNLTK